MKIVYNIAGTYNSGGMERVLANKANYLIKLGYEIIIITTDQRTRKPFFFLDERIKLYDLGINYAENNESFLKKIIQYPFKLYKHKTRLTTLLQELKPNIVVSMFCNDASFLPEINDGSEKILEIHFSRFKRLQYGRKGLWRLVDWCGYWIDGKVVKRFDQFVVLTEEDKEYWGNIPNIKVIPNARTFTLSQPAKLQQKKVIAVGRLNRQKGFERLIKAWKIVNKEISDWTLHIVGEGELREELRKQIEILGLSDFIVLEKPEKDIISVYQNASILAMSSYYEGLPMVLLEAQAAGLPIVSFACKCGPKDVIEDGVNGFLVPEGEIEELASKLIVLMNDEILRKKMGRLAFMNSNRYSEEIIMGRWIESFNELVRL